MNSVVITTNSLRNLWRNSIDWRSISVRLGFKLFCRVQMTPTYTSHPPTKTPQSSIKKTIDCFNHDFLTGSVWCYHNAQLLCHSIASSKLQKSSFNIWNHSNRHRVTYTGDGLIDRLIDWLIELFDKQIHFFGSIPTTNPTKDFLF